MNELQEPDREVLVERVRRRLAVQRSPKLILYGILAVTGLAGFFTSVGMLRLGLGAMWLRYPLAVLVAWGVFLLLVRWWAEQERQRDLAEWENELSRQATPLERLPKAALAAPPPPDRSGWNWLDWLDWLTRGEGEGLVIGLAIFALCSAVAALAGLFLEADTLLAEVLLDAVLVSAFYRRLRRLKPQWWLASATRQTMRPVLWTAVSLMLLGLLAHHYMPAAKSLGQAWKITKTSGPRQ